MSIQYARQGDTVELMVFEHYGRQDGRLVERVIDDLQNRHLAELPEILPIGTLVFMPDIEPLRKAEDRLIVNPWDR